MIDKIRQAHVDTPFRYILMSLFLAGIHSLMEEYYWRWFVFAELHKRMAWSSALIVASLGFMAHHVIILSVFFPGKFWSAAVPLSLCVGVGGGVWCWLYRRAGTIYSPWLRRMIDLGILAVGYDMAFVLGAG